MDKICSHHNAQDQQMPRHLWRFSLVAVRQSRARRRRESAAINELSVTEEETIAGLLRPVGANAAFHGRPGIIAQRFAALPALNV